MPDPLATATNAIRDKVSSKNNPLSWLEAAFVVTERMSESDAKEALGQLIRRQFLSVHDADLAQMLAARLGVQLQWSHKPLAEFISGDGEWIEGRGS